MYGKKTNYPGSRGYGTTARPSPPGEEDPGLCKDPKVDAMFESKDGETFVFKGTYENHIILLTLTVLVI